MDAMEATLVLPPPAFGPGSVEPLPQQWGARPAPAWLALARQRGLTATPEQTVIFLKTILRILVEHGGVPHTMDSIWITPDASNGMLVPTCGPVPTSLCLNALGLLACEMMSGQQLPVTMHPNLALFVARSKVESLHASAWDPALGFALESLFGLGLGYKSVAEAHAEFEILFLPTEAIRRRPALREVPAQLESPSSTPWLRPAVGGFVAGVALVTSLGTAYAFGRHHAQAPVALQASVPVPSSRIEPPPIQQLVIDPNSLRALAEVMQPKAPQPHAARAGHTPPSPKPAPVRFAAEPAQVDDEPIRVEERVAMGPRRDTRRVVEGDFVAIARK